MEKKNKITIKLFEEFKNDNIFINTRVNEIFDYLNANKIVRDGNSWNIGPYSIAWSGDGVENKTISCEITHIFKNTDSQVQAEDYDESISFEIPFEITGGDLISHETRLDPAEYSDEEYQFDNITEMKYSKYWDSHDQSLQDIDFMDVNITQEIQDKVETFVTTHLI